MESRQFQNQDGQPVMMQNGQEGGVFLPPGMMQAHMENQQLLQAQFQKCQNLMYQNYLQSQPNLSQEQQLKKHVRFMYEEESHYYIDVLCDDFCEIDNQNQIFYVEDQVPAEPDSALTPIKETTVTLDEMTEDDSKGVTEKKQEISNPITDKLKEQKMTFNTGRWTDEEHELFLEGLRLYEKDWELIQLHVKTRGIANIRAHAQKFFAKLVQIIDSDESPDEKTKQYHTILSKKVHKSQRWKRNNNDKEPKVFHIEKQDSTASKTTAQEGSSVQTAAKQQSDTEKATQDDIVQIQDVAKEDSNEQPPMMEMAYYKWYNEVWPTLYNKDPNENLLKGTINIVKRDSIKSKEPSGRNVPMISSFNSNQQSSKSGHSRNNRYGAVGQSTVSNNSIKFALNMRISANSSNRKNSQVSGGAPQAFFMPQSLQEFLNNNQDAMDGQQAFNKNDDMMDEKQSFHSGSLGNEHINAEQPYMNMLNQQNQQMRRQTLQVNPNILGQLDHQMYLQQQQLQQQIMQNEAIHWQMSRAGTLMPTGSGPMQPPNGVDYGQQMMSHAYMINQADDNRQWNTDRNGHVPFMGYQTISNMPGQSQTLVQKPVGLGNQQDHVME